MVNPNESQRNVGQTKSEVGKVGGGQERTGNSHEEVEKGKDPNLVTWYGPDDPENP